MSWRDNTEAAATDLARLLVRCDGLHPDDVDIALVARRRLLELASDLHRGLIGVCGDHALPTLAGLAEDPVRTLGQLLHRQVHPEPAASPVEVLAAEPAGATGVIWSQLAQHGTLAYHHWSTANAASRPSADAAWTVMDHVALLTRAITVVDGTAARTGESVALAGWRAGRHDVAQQLPRGSGSGLREAAAMAYEVALSGACRDLRTWRRRPHVSW